MASSDVLSALAQVVPVLATALGGPLAGLATKVLGEVAGLVPSDLSKPVTGLDKDLLVNAENEFVLRCRQLGIDEAAIHQKDRESARAREQQVGGYANPILAAVVLVGFLLGAWWVLTGRLTIGADAGMVGAVIGYMSAKADQVVSYYFGSSAAQDHNLLKA